MEKPERLVSLDVFRGITIAGMILVNNPGSWDYVYPALQHAKWHGVTPTDLIFPFFLFIVGLAITISLSKRKEQGADSKKLIQQIIKRSIVIFMLGLIMNGFPYYELPTIRIMSVLQRIAIVYLISSLIFLKSSEKAQIFITIFILLFYWAIMTLIPVPGVGYPNLEPSTNLSAYVDRMVLGSHIWYYSKVYDPEGILSTIPSVATCLIGIITGQWLRKPVDKLTKTVWMFVFGSFGLVIGTIWDMWFPINKNIWTSSYVVFTGGMALQFMAICYFLVDVKGYKWWTKPFIVFGMNAIIVYFFSEIMAYALYLPKISNTAGQSIDFKVWLYETIFASWLSPLNASLAWALVYVLFWLGILWFLYKKKIFIKI
ncbi:MAG: acyltransferase family protein [Bacillota bacterium]